MKKEVFCYDYWLFFSQDSGMQLKLGKIGDARTRTDISTLDLTTFPCFLRFNGVDLYMSDESETYSGGESDTLPITEKCLLFEKQLQSVKSALTGSVLCFWGVINESKASCFHDHLELLNYVRNRILPICDESCGYEFHIMFESDVSASQNVISSILQTPQLNRCSSAQFRIYDGSVEPELELILPVKEISNWLHRKCDHGRKKLLHINSGEIEMENIEEMSNHLTEVLFLCTILNA